MVYCSVLCRHQAKRLIDEISRIVEEVATEYGADPVVALSKMQKLMFAMLPTSVKKQILRLLIWLKRSLMMSLYENVSLNVQLKKIFLNGCVWKRRQRNV